MRSDAQQEHQPKNFPGYRPLLPAQMSGGAIYGYVLAAAAFGIILGLVLAVYAGHAKYGVARDAGTSINSQPMTPGR